MDWAELHSFNYICFETIVEPCTAHYFYARNKFIEVSIDDLPKEFKIYPYPSRYFIKRIKATGEM